MRRRICVYLLTYGRERERGSRSKIMEKPCNKQICNFFLSAYVINVTKETELGGTSHIPGGTVSEKNQFSTELKGL
jgi:hypothetical protein